MYLSLAHTDDDLSETLAVCRDALMELQRGKRSDS